MAELIERQSLDLDALGSNPGCVMDVCICFCAYPTVVGLSIVLY